MATPTTDQPPARRRRSRIIIPIAILAAVLLAIAGIVGWRAANPEPITISGGLTLTDTDPNTAHFEWDEQPAPTCRGVKGFNDIAQGASITIRNGDGKVVAVGQLGAGFPGGISETPGFLDNEPIRIATTCMFRFTIAKVPAADFYGIEITHRGSVNYSRQQVEGNVQLKLGS